MRGWYTVVGGGRSNRQTDPGVRQAILRRYDEVYDGFGPTLAAEKLAGKGYGVHHETLRRWPLAEGKWQRQRRRSPYRARRERRAQFGALVQMDGSIHHWFGPDHPQSCLMEMVDEATGIRLALMAKEETTEACLRLLWQWVERYGIPKALYTDKKNVFIIGARPSRCECQGRVERAHGVQQDRLVKELRLCGVRTIYGANEVLCG